MKILLINNSIEKLGGAEAVFLNTIDLLIQEGHKVVAFTMPPKETGTKRNYKTYFADTKAFGHNTFYSFSTARQIKKIIFDEKPDLVHVHNIIGGITYSILRTIRKQGIPIVATIHDFRLLCPAYAFINGKNDVCEKCLGGKYYHCISERCSPKGFTRSILLAVESYLRDFLIPFTKAFDEIIFVSEFSRNKYLQVYPGLKEKNVIIFNSTNEFDSCKTKGNYFLFFGRLVPIKGVITLLKAFKNLPNCKLVIAGDGELKETIENLKTTNVELIGYKCGIELKEIIKNSFFVILTAECYETNSMVIVESFALSKPVIASKIGAIPELILNGKNGFTFEPKNSIELGEIIEKCAEMSAERYYEISNEAFISAVDNFSPEVCYDSLIELYKATIKKSLSRMQKSSIVNSNYPAA